MHFIIITLAWSLKGDNPRWLMIKQWQRNMSIKLWAKNFKWLEIIQMQTCTLYTPGKMRFTLSRTWALSSAEATGSNIEGFLHWRNLLSKVSAGMQKQREWQLAFRTGRLFWLMINKISSVINVMRRNNRHDKSVGERKTKNVACFAHLAKISQNS